MLVRMFVCLSDVSKRVNKIFLLSIGSGTKCLKNQPWDVIKMRDMRGEVGKKTPVKERDNPSFL